MTVRREYFVRRFEAKALSGTVIELVLDGFELLRGDRCKVHAFRQIPTEQTDDILNRSLLPRRVGIAKEDWQTEGLPFRILGAAVECKRAPEFFFESAQALFHRTLPRGC